MITERLLNGERRFVHQSQSGRKYIGTSPEEVERKRLLAMLHAANRELSPHLEGEGKSMVRELCESMFGTSSFGSLTVPQMRELKAMIDESRRAEKKLEEKQALEPKLTPSQKKRIIKLGLYVLGPVYGKEWFWKKCKAWIVRLHDANRVNLDELTNQEAWYMIRRLERIEKHLKSTGEIMADAEMEKL